MTHKTGSVSETYVLGLRNVCNDSELIVLSKCCIEHFTFSCHFSSNHYKKETFKNHK